MAAGGENRWPYLGRNRWPLTDLLARLISDQHVVLLRRPVNARIGISHQNFNSILVRSSQAPRPRGTVADAYRQALNTGLRPVAACGTSPPPRGAGPRKALHTGGQAKRSPLPAAVEATTRMTYRQRSRAAGAGLTTAAGRKRSRDVRDGDARLRRIASAPVGAGGWIRMIKASVPLNRPRLGRSASGLATHAGRTVL